MGPASFKKNRKGQGLGQSGLDRRGGFDIWKWPVQHSMILIYNAKILRRVSKQENWLREHFGDPMV